MTGVFISLVNIAAIAVVIVGKSDGIDFPLLTVKNVTMFTSDSISKPINNTYQLPPYFSELEFECNSSYPTQWVFSKNTYQDENLREIPKIIKTRLPLNPTYPTSYKDGPFIFSSTVLLRFKKTDFIPNITCQGLKAYKGKGLCSSVLVFEPIISGAFVLKIQNGTPDVSDDTAMRRRFGKNEFCNLTIHVNPLQKKYACRSTSSYDTRQIKSKIIECNNRDECRSFIRPSNCTNNVEIEEMEFPCTKNQNDCVKFDPNLKPGVIICYDGVSDLAVKYQLARDQKKIFLADFKFASTKGTELLYINPDSEEEIEVYDMLPYTNNFFCNASMFTFTHGIQWFLQKGHQPDLIMLRTIQGADEKRNELEQYYTSSVNVTFYINESTEQFLSCVAPIWNSNNFTTKTIKLKVLESYKPKNVIIRRINNNTLQCTVLAVPMANITWTWMYKNANSSNSRVNMSSKQANKSELDIRDFSSGKSGEVTVTFKCEAENFRGTVIEKLEISFQGSAFPYQHDQQHKLDKPILITCGCIAFFILALCTLFVVFKIKKQNELNLTDADIEEFEKGARDRDEENNNPIFLPYNVKFEIAKESLTMDDGILGSGFFGMVKKGRYENSAVAIKTVKRSADAMHFKALLSELKIMCHIGHHPHLVNLVGACTKNIRKKELYIVVEFCSNGNLMKLLRNCRGTFVNHYASGMIRQSAVQYVNADGKKLSTKDVVRWSAEIASGMEFLSSNNIVHGDLAARNVLISEDMTAKLCDFGLSKQLCDYTVYVQKPEKPLPVKWLAIESLRDLEFSLESDIWSYGVTIWEIFSLGQSPYPGLQWDHTSWNLLDGGYRMSKPEFCNDTIYKLMLQCWDKNPKSRLPFGHLRIAFENELNEVHKRVGSGSLD